MPIITLSRELGSRGDDIAVAVAERLKLRLVGRDLLNQAARQAGVPEVALAEIDELGLLGVKPGREALQRYQLTVEEVMRGLADAGNVMLIGRGSQIVLAGCAGVLHVRIIAPRAERARCVQERCHVSAEAAAARIDASDRARASYLRRSYDARWDDPMLYALILNMAHLTVERAVELLCVAAHQAAAAAGEMGTVQA
ncbi:MAG: cytidylate kinase-like family protein [Anaerolineae bacterium]|nr:cytidylate kinase-like family protein [Anaerolineae bacterium]